MTLIKELKGTKHDFIELQRILTRRGELVCHDNTETASENRLGQAILDAGIKLIPQFRVGEYLFDFKLLDFPILIEVDGKIHNEYQVREKDYRKDRYAQRRGFKVLRFTNREIATGSARCVQEIQHAVQNISKQPKMIWLYPLGLWEQLRMWLSRKYREAAKSKVPTAT